ncbi:MAG: galactokinase [Opitutales bacterium]
METLTQTARQSFESTYGHAPSHTAFAPGRVEFIGNHTDYNGGFVLGASLDLGVAVAASATEDSRLRVTSDGKTVEAAGEWRDLKPLKGEKAWANYLLGVAREWACLSKETPKGVDVAVASNLPSGAGLSSSAALELATAYALGGVLGQSLGKLEMARLGRRAENDFVGVPCGILDQGVSAHGEANHLVRIDCRDETFATVPLPEGTAFHLFNTGIKHALVDSFYADRHRECMQVRDAVRAEYPDVEYLAFAEEGMLDGLDLDTHLVRRAQHVIRENQRVHNCIHALQRGDLDDVGTQLCASHASSRDLFENSLPELDFVVDALRAQPGVIGARLSGGGFGGAVLAFTRDTYTQVEAQSVGNAFRERFARPLTWLQTSTGPGARLL